MSNIVIKTVSNNKELKEFIRFHTELYKDSPTDIPYLEMGEIDTLRSDKNPAFAFCEAEYYIAYRDGKPVGRIAAIINKRANETWGLKAVRFGWFDFIDDIEVSTALINKVKEYGRARGLENIIGPLGFTDMDREGLQVSGFDYMASMHSNHNFAYYQEHMEKMGEFTKENDWVQLEIKVPDEVPEKFAKVAAMIEKRYNLRARKMTKKELVSGGMGKKFFDILNTCYSHLYNYSRVGFGVSFPSFSEALKKTKNGKLLPFGWYHLLKALKFHDTKTVDLLLCGVLPEYRAKGANALIFKDLIQWYQKYGFEKALALPMMETNEGVLGQWQYLDSREVMRLRSYTSKIN